MRDRLGSSATLLTVGGFALFLCVPLAIALGVLYEPRWQPVSDIAQLEMRVRDVIHGPLPQIGLGGRFVAYGEVGSHPGALIFYLLAPVYWLFGSDGWGLLVSTAVLTAAGTVLAIWMGYRRGGWQLTLLVTAMLAVLFRAHGPETVLEPWTPHLVIVWWVVFLLAVWSVLCRDWPMLPVAVLAGSLCVQTHVGYTGIVLGLGGLTLAWGMVTLVRNHRRAAREEAADDQVEAVVAMVGSADDPSSAGNPSTGDNPSPADNPSSDPSAGARGRLARWRPNRWVVVSLALGVVVWLQTLIQELTNDPGNVTILVESFRHPVEDRVELSLAFESWMAHLNPVTLLDGGLEYRGPIAPGLLFLAVWAGAVFLSWRRSHRDLLYLHAVVGVATVLGLIAMSGVYGILWSYLIQWAWGTTGLMLLAIVWTGWRELPESGRTPTLAGLGAAALVVVVMFAADATTTEMPQSHLTTKVDRMTEATLARLADDPAGCGDDCRYRVTSSDPLYVASEAFGIMMDFERHGITAGSGPGLRAAVREHRVIEDDEVDATLHVAVTDEVIAASAMLPGAEQIAYVDPYSDQERAANDELRQELVAVLRADGYDHLVEQASTGCNGLVPIENGMSSDVIGLVERVNAIYCPSAIFLILP